MTLYAGISAWLGLSVLALLSAVSGYIGMFHFLHPPRRHVGFADDAVPISDTDQLRETCSGMYGGSEAFIEGMSPGFSSLDIMRLYIWRKGC